MACVCHSLAACVVAAAVIGLSNNDVISLRSLRLLRCVGCVRCVGGKLNDQVIVNFGEVNR